MRGAAYGQQMAKRIHRAFDFYNDVVFKVSPLAPKDYEARARHLMAVTHRAFPNLVAEIEAVAEAAGRAPWQVFLLNARTEILNASVGECTSFAFPQTRVLAQTWDWIRELEDLVVVLQAETETGRYVSLVEPGMLGKIGMNSRGLGVGLNFLKAPHDLDGVPVHLVLRALLDCGTLDEARAVVARSGRGKASYIPVATASGEAAGFEFAGDQGAELAPEGGVLLHTNHCLAEGLAGQMLPTSQPRYDTTQTSLKRHSAGTVADANALLSDDSQGEVAVLRRYSPVADMGGLDVGTCATIVMELDHARFRIRRGPNPEGAYTVLDL